MAVHVGDTLYPLHYGGELGTGLGHLFHPLVGLLYALGHQLASLMGIALQLFDHLLDLDGGGLSPVGQLANFGGHHGKAATRFTGAGRLDGRVKCQQVGLFRDAANGVDHRANALDPLLHLVDHGGGALDVAGEGVDGADGVGDAAAPLFRQLAGFGGGVRGLIRMGGHFANGADHLAHGAGQLFDLGELFVDRFVGLFHAKGHLGGDVVELLAGGALVAKYLFEVLLRV